MYYLSHPLFLFIAIVAWFCVGAFLVKIVCNTLLYHYFSRTHSHDDDAYIARIRSGALLLMGLLLIYISTNYVYPFTEYGVHVNRLLTASGVVVGAYVLSELIALIVHGVSAGSKNYSKSHSPAYSALPFMKTIIRMLLAAGAAIWVMAIYDVDITPAIASAGVVGVAIAFAAKDFIANLFGGISVFFDRPYSVGDYVIIQDTYRGEVKDIGMRSTKIATRDNVLLTVPNSVMVTSAVINETGFDPHLRIRVPMQVEYTSDLATVESVLLDVAHSHSGVLHHDPPLVRFRGFRDSGIEVELMVIIKNPSMKGRIVHELVKQIHEACIKNSIAFAFPTRTILTRK